MRTFEIAIPHATIRAPERWRDITPELQFQKASLALERTVQQDDHGGESAAFGRANCAAMQGVLLSVEPGRVAPLNSTHRRGARLEHRVQRGILGFQRQHDARPAPRRFIGGEDQLGRA